LFKIFLHVWAARADKRPRTQGDPVPAAALHSRGGLP
jgi:hypothetical protein